MRRQLWLLAGAGLAPVLLARVLIPTSPALYDGIPLPQVPYRWVCPPANLASSNEQPRPGTGTISFTNGRSKAATLETDDKQVLVFFPEMVFQLDRPSLDVHITPLTEPPPPPANSALVGNVYLISAGAPPAQSATPSCGSPTPSGAEPPSGQPPLLTSAQALLRIPPVAYNSVQLRYDGAWHKIQYFGQPDYINVGIDHLGEVAAFEESGREASPGRPVSSFPVWIPEVALAAIALAIIVAGVIAQRRRAAN